MVNPALITGRACDVGIDHHADDDHDPRASEDAYEVIVNHSAWTNHQTAFDQVRIYVERRRSNSRKYKCDNSTK